MNKLDFSVKTGWPGSTETWEFMQNMILQAQTGSNLGGNYWIVSGCVESAGNVTDGMVCINGELLPFVGGPVQTNVVISENVTERAYFGGSMNPYYKERSATFGTGSGAIAWASFKRNDPANGVLARLDKVEKMLKPLLGYEVGGVTKYGSWLFWGRPADEIPAGWEPVPDEDWKGKVPVVMNTDDVDFDTVGKIGGNKTHTLSRGELPNIQLKARGGQKGSTATGGTYDNSLIDWSEVSNPHAYTANIENLGSGMAHNNVQPYKVVMFIRFVG